MFSRRSRVRGPSVSDRRQAGRVPALGKMLGDSSGEGDMVTTHPDRSALSKRASVILLAPDGMWFSPTPYFRSYGVVGLQRCFPASDEAVKAGHGLHPPDAASGSLWKGV